MKWISVDEKLPVDGQRVLLYTPYPYFGKDYSCVGDRDSITTCTVCDGCREVPIFTHWMPLPPQPGQH